MADRLAGRRRVRLPDPSSVEAQLAEAVRRYISEVENPAPDYTMRRVERDRMKAALRGYDAEMEARKS